MNLDVYSGEDVRVGGVGGGGNLLLTLHHMPQLPQIIKIITHY